MLQKSQPADVWMQRFEFWNHVIGTFMPQGGAAVTEPFYAILLRAGATSAIEDELIRRDFKVFDPVETSKEITRCAERLPHGGAAKKAEAEVNKVLSAESSDLRAELRRAEDLEQSRAELRRAEQVDRAVQMLEEFDAECSRLQYAGNLANDLKQMGVSQMTFDHP